MLSKVVTDAGKGLWKEIATDGTVTAYPIDSFDNLISFTYVGNRHSSSYASGLLSTLQDVTGQLVSLIVGIPSLAVSFFQILSEESGGEIGITRRIRAPPCSRFS